MTVLNDFESVSKLVETHFAKLEWLIDNKIGEITSQVKLLKYIKFMYSLSQKFENDYEILILYLGDLPKSSIQRECISIVVECYKRISNSLPGMAYYGFLLLTNRFQIRVISELINSLGIDAEPISYSVLTSHPTSSSASLISKISTQKNYRNKLISQRKSLRNQLHNLIDF